MYMCPSCAKQLRASYVDFLSVNIVWLFYLMSVNLVRCKQVPVPYFRVLLDGFIDVPHPRTSRFIANTLIADVFCTLLPGNGNSSGETGAPWTKLRIIAVRPYHLRHRIFVCSGRNYTLVPRTISVSKYDHRFGGCLDCVSPPCRARNTFSYV